MAQLWTSRDTEETIFTTELNSLADGGRVITSAAKSNDASGERRPYCDVEMKIATQGSSRDTGANIQVFFLPELDDSDYAYGGSSLDPPANCLVGVIPFDNTTASRVNILTHVPLPNSDFHILVKNDTGQALASSGNALSLRRYALEDV